jgi:hypothetical protein
MLIRGGGRNQRLLAFSPKVKSGLQRIRKENKIPFVTPGHFIGPDPLLPLFGGVTDTELVKIAKVIDEGLDGALPYTIGLVFKITFVGQKLVNQLAIDILLNATKALGVISAGRRHIRNGQLIEQGPQIKISGEGTPGPNQLAVFIFFLKGFSAFLIRHDHCPPESCLLGYFNYSLMYFKEKKQLAPIVAPR